MEGKVCWSLSNVSIKSVDQKITSVQKGKEAGQGQKESEKKATGHSEEQGIWSEAHLRIVCMFLHACMHKLQAGFVHVAMFM